MGFGRVLGKSAFSRQLAEMLAQKSLAFRTFDTLPTSNRAGLGHVVVSKHELWLLKAISCHSYRHATLLDFSPYARGGA